MKALSKHEEQQSLQDNQMEEDEEVQIEKTSEYEKKRRNKPQESKPRGPQVDVPISELMRYIPPSKLKLLREQYEPPVEKKPRSEAQINAFKKVVESNKAKREATKDIPFRLGQPLAVIEEEERQNNTVKCVLRVPKKDRLSLKPTAGPSYKKKLDLLETAKNTITKIKKSVDTDNEELGTSDATDIENPQQLLRKARAIQKKVDEIAQGRAEMDKNPFASKPVSISKIFRRRL